jgi:hypothetical protein
VAQPEADAVALEQAVAELVGAFAQLGAAHMGSDVL